MSRHLKLRLTLLFVSLSMVFYALIGFVALFVFDSLLTNSIDDVLNRFLSEFAMEVNYADDHPSLRAWSSRVERQNVDLLVTTQLFDNQRQLLERYGPPGVPRLSMQPLHSGKVIVTSKFLRLFHEHRPSGYLQVQITGLKQKHEQEQFGYTLLWLGPVFAIALGISGYLVAGKAVEPLERALLLLRRFVADAGHELNTPVSIIEASLETLEETLRKHDVSTDVMRIASRASKRLKELASNLIYLARLETPSLITPKEPICTIDIAHQVVDEFTALAKSKKIDMIVKTGAPFYMVANSESMRRLLTNLVQNAVKYTPSGGQVKVSVEKHDDTAIVTVEDTGIGMSADVLDHIFERFYRLDPSRSRADGGTGLGLSIVKAIAEAHRGRVLVESTPEKGSKFTVILPLKS